MRESNVVMIRNREAQWEDILDDFISLKKAQGRSKLTIRTYYGHVEKFFRTYPEAWDSKHLRRSLLKYLSRGVGNVAYNLDLVTLKGFLDYCVEEGIFPSNELKGLKSKRTTPRIVNIPKEELKALIKLPDRSTYVGLRDYTLMLLTIDTGIRPGEALSLLPSDINIKALEVYVRAENAKTRVSRTLPISSTTGRTLRKLIMARPPEWDDTVTLFSTCTGEHLQVESWTYRMRNVYSPKLRCRIRPYDLRHVFALNFLRNDGNIFALQRIMGHSDLNMTRRYLALTEGDIQKQHEKASPVSNLICSKKRLRKIKR